MKAHYDSDSGTIQIWFPDGTLISVLREAVEDELNLGPAQEDKFSRLLYDHPAIFMIGDVFGMLFDFLQSIDNHPS